MEKLRLAYLVTHPIPYQAPLLRMMAAQPDIDFTAFFGTDFTTRPFVAGEFGQQIVWDVPLVEGYRHRTLARLDPTPPAGILEPLTLWRPLSRGFARELDEGRFDALWIHGYAHFSHWAAIASAKCRGIKVMIRDEATPISAVRSPAKRLAKRAFFEILKRGVDAYLAIGSMNRQYWRDQGVPDSRIFHVPYAVDNDRFAVQAADASKSRDAFKRELGIAPGRPVILFCAKLIERKRPRLLLDAFARIHADPAMRNPVLAFVGDGPQRGELEAAAAALGPDAVRFLGFKKQNELPPCYDLCDVFVLPSGQEAWGLVVNEVMCAGKAVICSDSIGAAPDLVRPGANGAIFRTDDLADLSRALGEVLRDAAGLAAMGRQSAAIISTWSYREDVAGLRAALAAVCPGRIAP
ncbi:MAG: glycosyltransferase family 4 protein [Rhodospirillales bacterium]|nr:glycosyltransferase family 4 protein [Rhodospirillales bacterium]